MSTLCKNSYYSSIIWDSDNSAFGKMWTTFIKYLFRKRLRIPISRLENILFMRYMLLAERCIWLCLNIQTRKLTRTVISYACKYTQLDNDGYFKEMKIIIYHSLKFSYCGCYQSYFTIRHFKVHSVNIQTGVTNTWTLTQCAHIITETFRFVLRVSTP